MGFAFYHRVIGAKGAFEVLAVTFGWERVSVSDNPAGSDPGVLGLVNFGGSLVIVPVFRSGEEWRAGR